ncbi:Exosome complex component MTR3 [Chytriomyces hyalinus]|nr:Exosome complex component MTR3 [Chytriomyces hyalinus]
MDSVDRKRIHGPDKSVLPLPLLDSQHESVTPKTTLNPSARFDGRTHEEVRPLFARTAMVSQANGSAYIEVGCIKIICAVYGPKQITTKSKSGDHHSGGRISCDVRLAPFAGLKRKGYMKDTNEHSLAKNLATALTPSLLLAHLPKSQIDIHIQILQATAGHVSASSTSSTTVLPPPSFATNLSLLLSPCITVASLALADAGIEMMDSVVGCSVGLFRRTDKNSLFWMVDPSEEERETRALGGGVWVGNAVVGVMPSVGRISGLVVDGDVGDVGVLMEAVNVCVDACAKVHDVVVKKALVEGFHAASVPVSGSGSAV